MNHTSVEGYKHWNRMRFMMVVKEDVELFGEKKGGGKVKTRVQKRFIWRNMIGFNTQSKKLGSFSTSNFFPLVTTTKYLLSGGINYNVIHSSTTHFITMTGVFLPSWISAFKSLRTHVL